LTTWIGRATLHLLLLVPTTLGSRLVLPVLVFLAWAPAAHAWTWPVQGPVLQPFVYDEAHPYASGQHRGIDIGADTTGESVVAPAAGTVEFAGTVPTSGKSVTIETPDGYSVTLTHLGSILVSKGAPVAEGETVGTIGPSGTAEVDGPYVHLGIRVAADPNGYIDPLSLLPAAAAASPPTESVSAPSQPSAGGGSGAAPANAPAPAAPASPSVATTRGSTAAPRSRRVSHHGRGRTQKPGAEVEPQQSAQRPVSHPATAGRRVQQRARMPHRRPSEPASSSHRAVVEVAAPREPTGLDASHELEPSMHVGARSRSSQPETSAVPLPLVCNGAAALVALAAAFAAARRRRRDLASRAGAQVLQLPRPVVGRRWRHAA